MKQVNQLMLGFRDAENYRRKSEKEFFNKIFLRTPELDQLCEPNIFFLIGEKGTGKTAYAVYLSNMEYRDRKATHKYLRETEYLKFVSLKRTKNLQLSDYMSIWKVIIFLLIAQQIREKEKSPVFKGFPIFARLGEAIDEFYQHAFSPEIINAIKFAEESSISAKLISKIIQAGGEEKTSFVFSESNFQVNLLYIQKKFEEAFSSIKLSKNYILFIDGIDIRPQSVDYEAYIECIKGLANAVWSVNNDFFANIKDSKGRIKVVLLVRPDIFNALGLQNQNSKVKDNSVILNWITTYKDYKTSPLFLMADQLFSLQQDRIYPSGTVWNYYFPYNASNVKASVPLPSSFIQFLRYSLHRPRNVLTIFSIQQENFQKQGRNPNDVFKLGDFNNPEFTRKYSDFLLGEIRDHISFYYDEKNYESLLKFFQFLNGHSTFTYSEFIDAFRKFLQFLRKNFIEVPPFCATPDSLLQFLYDLNVLGCIIQTTDKKNPFFSWCNRDRSLSNIAPKVRTNVNYEIHYGLMKALDLGKKFIVDEYDNWNDSEDY
jgi:hypothetical protein